MSRRMMKAIILSAGLCYALALGAGGNDKFYVERLKRPLYTSYRSFGKQLDMTGKFGEMGIETRCFFAANTINSGGRPYCDYPVIWRYENQYDWDAFYAQADDLIGASPRADFLVMIDLNTPYWATHRFHLDSFTDVTHAACDPEWIEMTSVWMTNFIAHAEARYGDRIRAYILSGGGTSEWYEFDRGRSSRKKNAAWREWQRRHGCAFGECVPDETALGRAAFEDLVYDPVTEADKIAYWQFHNSVVADALLAFGRVARNAVPRDKEIGTFFGYLFVTGTNRTSFGHLDYERVYASPDFDFFMAPGNYSDRAMGGGSGSQLVMGTALLNGKRFLHEIDYGPHTQTKWMRGVWKTLEDDIAGNTREAAFAIANGAHSWWFDMWGGKDGFYDQPEVRERIAKLKSIQDELKGGGDPTGAQVMLVTDPQSAYSVNEKDEKAMGFGEHLRNEMSCTGAIFDVFSFNDLAKLDLSQYRLICLFSTVLITPERAKFLRERVCCDGRTILWLYAPGVSDGRTLDSARVRTWTGVDFRTPGVSVRELDGWRAVYAYDYRQYTTESLIRILEGAGVHRYVGGRACVYANERFVSVHVRDGGVRMVCLPRKVAKVVDLLTGRVVTENADRFKAEFASPDTKLFGIVR